MAYWATGTVACQPLTPSVVLLLRGTPGLSPPPPRQRTALLPDQSAWPRQLAPSACFRMLEGCRAPTPAVSTIHEHDRDLPDPARHLTRLPSRDALAGGLAPFGALPAEPLGIRGPQRLSPPRAPPGSDRSLRGWLPRSARLGHLLSRAGGSNGWRSRPRQVHDARTRYVPTRRACLRETRRRTSRLRETFRQGSFLRAPAKELTFHTPKVSSIAGRSSWETGTRPVNRSRSRRFQEGLGDCPQVVPNLWRFRQRLFNPCLWDTS